jgi:hypothetical protein
MSTPSVTLAQLAPLLPHRVEAKCPHGHAVIERLDTAYQFAGDSRLCNAVGMYEWLGEPGKSTRRLRMYRPEEVKPVLSGLDDLTKKNKFDEVPAEKIMRLAWGIDIPGEKLRYEMSFTLPPTLGGDAGLYMKAFGPDHASYVTVVLEGFRVRNYRRGLTHHTEAHVLNPFAIHEYLQKNQFAVGFLPGQYIQK